MCVDVLFGAADLRADFVVTRLHGAHAFGLLGLVDALRFDGRFRGALVGQRLLHRELALAHRAVLHLGAGIDLAQAQCQQLGRQAAFGFLQRLVAARGRRLALQVADLLVDFVAHVLQALEVFARVGDARLGFLAALLVAGDAGGFLDEGAHVIGLGLDDARDHALLDDGVAARSQAGAQEQLRDVLAAATRAIQEIVGRAVARHLALERRPPRSRRRDRRSCRRCCRTPVRPRRCPPACATPSH